MPRLPGQHSPAPFDAAVRRRARAWSVGVALCAMTLGTWLVASRTDGVEPRPLSARADEPKAVAAEDGPRFSLALTAGEQRLERGGVAQERELFRELPPGEASLAVSLEGDVEPLVVLNGLVVPPGAACSDPRLDPLDVSEHVATYRVRIVNERGEDVQGPVFRVAGDAAPTGSESPRTRLRAQLDQEASAVLGGGWWRIHARWPAPEISVSAVDHDPSVPCTLTDGSTVTLRSDPRFFIELMRDPPPGEVGVELEPPSGAPSTRHRVPAARVMRVPVPVAGKMRARLVQLDMDPADPRQWREIAAGPWVEFEVPDSVEGRVRLDLTL
jgi:hypothetical protein